MQYNFFFRHKLCNPGILVSLHKDNTRYLLEQVSLHLNVILHLLELVILYLIFTLHNLEQHITMHSIPTAYYFKQHLTMHHLKYKRTLLLQMEMSIHLAMHLQK